MKKFIYSFAFLAILSCKEQGNVTNQAIQDQLAGVEAKMAEEEKTKQFAEGYVAAMNSPNWKTEMRKYLKEPQGDVFLEGEYAKFRNSFPNAKTTIKHIAVDGNECILWLEETANFVAPFSVENSDYGDNILNGIEAKNQKLTWNEVWCFDVVNGKFGDKFDFLKDNYSVLKGLVELDK